MAKKTATQDDITKALRLHGGRESTAAIEQHLRDGGFSDNASVLTFKLTAMESKGLVKAVGYRPGPGGTIWSLSC